jgi:hypothetical protein
MLKEKWLSVQHHISNIHSWACNNLFHQCEHEALSAEEKRETTWLTVGSPAQQAVSKIVTKKKLMADLKQMTMFKHTGYYLYILPLAVHCMLFFD